MPYQFIGRTTTFKGKPLWEILGNLKNCGVGRLVIRQRFQRYPEPCFLKIMKVSALPNPVQQPFRLEHYNKIEERLVRVLVERTFRGQKFEELVDMENTTYKADYQLVPKDEEHKYLKPVELKKRILPRTMEFPPVLSKIIERNMKNKGLQVTEKPQMELAYNLTGHKFSRVAEEGEKPDFTYSIGLGKPANPELYKDVKPI